MIHGDDIQYDNGLIRNFRNCQTCSIRQGVYENYEFMEIWRGQSNTEPADYLEPWKRDRPAPSITRQLSSSLSLCHWFQCLDTSYDLRLKCTDSERAIVVSAMARRTSWKSVLPSCNQNSFPNSHDNVALYCLRATVLFRRIILQNPPFLSRQIFWHFCLALPLTSLTFLLVAPTYLSEHGSKEWFARLELQTSWKWNCQWPFRPQASCFRSEKSTGLVRTWPYVRTSSASAQSAIKFVRPATDLAPKWPQNSPT